ncbi:MAG: extracellular solute-binding protein [Candidatus Weimeria sp.]
MIRNKALAVILSAVMLLSIIFTGCGADAGRSVTGASSSDNSSETGSSNSSTLIDGKGKITLSIISGSENEELTDILQKFATKEKINIKMTYAGSLDIMRTLQSDQIDYDAVWPASSMWITAGDTNHRVKHLESVCVSPVVFGIRKSLAQSLGFVGKEVKVADLLSAIESGKLKFCMTSATQSNSGCCAYIGFLYALLGNPDMITADDLKDEKLAEQIKTLFSGVERTSGSSGWLKDMFLSGDYDAMVNYESMIISTNEELEKENKEPLYVVYPEDGLSIADSPLGYVDNGDSEKEEAFLKLQKYLLSDDVQLEIQRTGRRTGYKQSVADQNKDVFKEEWGVQPDRVLSPFRMPSTDVLMQALSLYQTGFRKPSLTVYCLDFSGSMYGDGEEQLKKAMKSILVQSEAGKNLLQASSDEINIVIPFSTNVLDVWTSKGNGTEIEDLYKKVENESVKTGTNMYAAAEQALKELKKYDLDNYTPAIIMMTDGMSIDYQDDFSKYYKENGEGIPVFSIMFGDADESQLDELAKMSNARVFDGRKDLVSAFRTVKGYN